MTELIIDKFKNFDSLISTKNIKYYIENLSKINGTSELKENLKIYKERLIKLMDILKPLLEDKDKIISILNIEKYIKPIFTNSFFSNYKNKIDKISWNDERIRNINIDGQEQEYIYIDNKYDENKFKEQLLILFSPFLTNTNKLFDISNDDPEKINENLKNEILKSEELINIAKEFQKYVIEKKQQINRLIIFFYKVDDITYIENINKITKNEYIEQLTEDKLKDEYKINVDTINKFINLIDTTIKSIDIVEEIEKFNEPVIFHKDMKIEKILEDILDMDNIVNIVNIVNVVDKKKIKRKLPEIPMNHKGGEFKTPYFINEETNKLLIELLKNLNILQEIFITTIDEAEYLKQLQLRYNNHINYLFSIIQRLLSRDETKSDVLEFYRYLDKNITYKYIEKINKIKRNITNNDEKYIFLNKYHYITIDKILNCLNYIYKNFPSENHLVDIYNCKGYIKNDLNLFNHFRKVIDSI